MFVIRVTTFKIFIYIFVSLVMYVSLCKKFVAFPIHLWISNITLRRTNKLVKNLVVISRKKEVNQCNSFLWGSGEENYGYKIQNLILINTYQWNSVWYLLFSIQSFLLVACGEFNSILLKSTIISCFAQSLSSY